MAMEEEIYGKFGQPKISKKAMKKRLRQNVFDRLYTNYKECPKQEKPKHKHHSHQNSISNP